MSCAPKREKTAQYTCYTYNELVNIAKQWNETHEDKKITIPKNKILLWEKLNKVHPQCDTENCWLKQDHNIINETLKRYEDNFRPEAQWGDMKTWLNTSDIDSVLKQYEEVYPHFKFLGVHPIDFMDRTQNTCISPNMCNLKLSKDKTHYGLVINLDRHNQSGSHWVSVFIDNTKNTIYYYDSVGNPPSKNIQDFVKYMNKTHKKKYKFVINKKQHQYSNTECGVYSILFIECMLKNNNFTAFVNRKNLDDKTVNKHRKRFFNIIAK